MKYFFSILFFLSFFNLCTAQDKGLPEGFVYVKEIIPEAFIEMRYAGENNFVGRKIDGYEKPVAILSRPAADALQKVQQKISKKGYCIKIFDAYRPQRAVNNFIVWARDEEDTLQKQEFYPDVRKENLFELGYIASKSGHSRGSTVDLTLVDCKTGKELDMGGSYDFFGKISHHNAKGISRQQKKNRRFLKNVMHRAGFRPYSEEWWHYTLRNEPYPDKYFNFQVQ